MSDDREAAEAAARRNAEAHKDEIHGYLAELIAKSRQEEAEFRQRILDFIEAERAAGYPNIMELTFHRMVEEQVKKRWGRVETVRHREPYKELAWALPATSHQTDDYTPTSPDIAILLDGRVAVGDRMYEPTHDDVMRSSRGIRERVDGYISRTTPPKT